jgi:hypothetical protein
MSSPTTVAAIGQQTTGRSRDGRDPAVSPLRGIASPLARQSEHAVEHFISPLTARAPPAAHERHESFYIVVGQHIACTLCGLDSIGHCMKTHAGRKGHLAALARPWRPPLSPHGLTVKQIKDAGIEQQLRLQKTDADAAKEKERKRRQSIRKRELQRLSRRRA